MTILLLAALLSTNGLGYVDRLVGTHDPRTSLCRFVDYERACGTQEFVLNTNSWLRGIDFSCVSPWNGANGRLRAGTAISPRHVVFSRHFALWKDVRIVFVSKAGTPSAYYIEKVRHLPECDISVGLLNAELVPDVRPAKVLPPDFAKHMGKLEGLPVVTINQDEKAMLSEMKPTYTNSPTYRLDDFREPAAKDRKPYHVKVRSGDSGSPTFLVCDNEPILLFCQTTTIGGYGLHRFRREVQAAMDALCPGYRLESFDFEKQRFSRGANRDSGLGRR